MENPLHTQKKLAENNENPCEKTLTKPIAKQENLKKKVPLQKKTFKKLTQTS